MTAADQAARNVAIVVAGGVDDATVGELTTTIDERGETTTGVLTVSGTAIGTGVDADDPEVQRALEGEAFTGGDDDGGRLRRHGRRVSAGTSAATTVPTTDTSVTSTSST